MTTVLAMLSLFALIATTFLVTTRYNRIGAESAAIAGQMEMLLSMLESDIRRKLSEDMWGNNATANNPGDGEHERYDAPDENHRWLTGICGKLIDWEKPDSGAADHVQYVIEGESDWIDLPGAGVDGIEIRYRALVQGLGGLINVNVARRSDPDMVGEGFSHIPDVDHPADWPHTIWAFHNQRGLGDWGYWWYTATKENTFGHNDLYGGMTQPIRGGGPLHVIDLRSMLADPGELSRIDGYFRDADNYGRTFDIQDELDLRFPGAARDGSPFSSMLEQVLPSLFSSSTPDFRGETIPTLRRRLVTAIGRTANWQVRRDPVMMHPYTDAFWEAQPTLDRTLCDESWYFRFDSAHFDDLIKYFHESRMGYRISLQRGVTFSRMWEDDEFDIYSRLVSGDGDLVFPPISGVADFPGRRENNVRGWPPYQYTDWTVDWEHRKAAGHYADGNAPTMITLLLANLMANCGVPDSSKDPDVAASYEPQSHAHLPIDKENRVRAYRKLVGAMHVNMEDFQDANIVPAMLRGNTSSKLRFARYGDRAGAESRPYLTEAVFEFELWPDYAIIWEKGGWRKSLEVYRVDQGTSAKAKGLRVDDVITAICTPKTAGSFVKIKTLADMRTQLQPLKTGQLIDLQVKRDGGTKITGVSLAVAVRTVAVEIYNPHDHSILIQDDSLSGSPKFRYNVGVQQQYEYSDGDETVKGRGFILHTPPDHCPVRTIPAGGTMLFVEFRSVLEKNVSDLMNQYGLAGISYYDAWGHRYRRDPIPCERGNLTNLREDGDLILAINHFTDGHTNYANYAYLSDIFRNEATHADPPPTPATPTVLPAPKGIEDAFAEARRKIDLGTPYPVVRLYRPRFMESRATQFMTVSNAWMNGAKRSVAAAGLGIRGPNEDDFSATVNADYINIDARGFLVTATNKSFRFGADLSRVTRLTQPRLKNLDSIYSGDATRQQRICTFDGEDGDPKRLAPTEIIDRGIRKTLNEIDALSGEKNLSSGTVRRMLQKFEARLRFSPYSPELSNDAEMAECGALHDFLDAFTVGGAAYDNIDNNANGVADEHGTHDYDLGETDSGGGWIKEHSNCWPAYGKINLNTAPLEVLEAALTAPTDALRRKLAKAVWTERGGEASQTNGDYKPFKSLGELYARVSVLNGYDNSGKGIGFDWFGFDNIDNHNGSDRLPDMTGWNAENNAPISLDVRGYVDDLDERNYLWRINSELVTLRTDTFVAYLRFQARRKTNGRWKILAERRVYSIWDRANCIWPPKRHDNKQHPDFVPPQRLGVQIFAY